MKVTFPVGILNWKGSQNQVVGIMTTGKMNRALVILLRILSMRKMNGRVTDADVRSRKGIKK